MTHCHFPEGEWSVTVYCPVFVHNAPTEGEDKEGRREWGVSPHTAKGKVATHWTLEEGRGDKIHENRHSICRLDIQYKRQTNQGILPH